MADASSIDGYDAINALQPPPDVIIPPPAIRQHVIKTAGFVHRKGPEMEEGIRKRTAGKAQFSFMNQDDPYYSYYGWVLQQFREGKDVALTGSDGAQAAEANKPKGPPEPAKFRFSARMPNISAQDLEILKLTALYTARNGENWLKELRNREAGNVQFDFLRPTHSFFQFFRAIIDQYKILLEEESTVEARIEELQKNIKNRFHVLDRAKQRAEYIKYVSQQKEKEAKKKEDEAREYASIDWHDFTVLNTVVFDERDEGSALPPPASLNDIQSASLETKASFSLNKRIEEAAPDEETYYNVSQQPPYAGYPPATPVTPGTPVAPAVQPVYAPPPMAASMNNAQSQSAREEEERRAEQERARAQAAVKPAPGSMRIRNDYVPRAAAKKASVHMLLCPNCKQQIPANEYDEHLRIELLDPRWKEQRQKADVRYATTMVNTSEVANNLKRFASQRDDIYDGVSGLPISEEEAARRKKAATSYDGQPDPTKDAARIQEMQSLNVQEQLRRIQERHGGK
jgi:splicing factor 3A subunit 1